MTKEEQGSKYKNSCNDLYYKKEERSEVVVGEVGGVKEVFCLFCCFVISYVRYIERISMQAEMIW